MPQYLHLIITYLDLLKVVGQKDSPNGGFMVIYYGRIRTTISKKRTLGGFCYFLPGNIHQQTAHFIITNYCHENHFWPNYPIIPKLEFFTPFWGEIPLLLFTTIWGDHPGGLWSLWFVASLAFTAIKATCKEWQVKTPGCRDTYPYDSYKIHKWVETKFFRFVGHSSVRWPKL